MTIAALAYPNPASLASILQDDQQGSLRAVVTIRPFDGPVTRSEQFVRIRPAASLLQEVVQDDVVGEHRVGPATFTSLDPADRYCYVRRELVPDDHARLFDHLAGPVAFVYQGTSDPAWRRLEHDARVTVYRRGALRLRATFDATTRLPLEASTEFGHIRWDYSRHPVTNPLAPALDQWRLEELEVRREARGLDLGLGLAIRAEPLSVPIEAIGPRFDPVDRLVQGVIGDHVHAQGTFRTSSMSNAQAFGDWTPIDAEVPAVRLAIDDTEPIVRTDPFTGPQFFLRPVRAGTRVGRLWASEPRYVDLGILPRTHPIELEADVTPDESSSAWRTRVARTVQGLVDEASPA